MKKFVIMLLVFLASCAPTNRTNRSAFTTDTNNFGLQEAVDPITGEDNSYVFTGEIDAPPDRSGTMAWACQGEILRILFLLDRDVGNRNVEVQYRLDDLNAISDRGWQVSNGVLSFPPETGLKVTAISFNLQPERFALRVFIPDDAPETYIFELSGLRAALSQLACAQWLIK